MKKIYNSILLAAIIMTGVMCSKEAEQEGKKIKNPDTIQASVASQDEKVSFSQGDAKLTLAWEQTDKIMVVGNTSEEYSIVEYSGKNASFTGEKVEGDSFDIYYPSSYATKEALMARSYTGQVQNGNGNMAHLQYNALIEEAADYHSIVFERAEGKKLNGVLKLVVKMPTEIDTVSSISITAPSAIFYTTNESDDTKKTDVLSLSFTEGTTVTENVLTAYIMTSMVDVTIPKGTNLVIKVTVPGSASFFQKTIHDDTQDISINGGQTLNIDIHDATVMTRKLAGEGTQASPYQIYDKYDMQVVKAHLEKKNSATETTYFELMNDVDMENEELVPIVRADDNTKPIYKIDFTSNGAPARHTLKKVKVTDQHYASIFGALNGKVHDVNFDNVQVTMTTDQLAAVVCAYLGALADGVVGYVENVNITNSSVDHTYSNPVVTGIVCGNFARGQIKNVNIDANSTVKQTITGTITEACAIGGVAGITKKNVPDGQEYSIKNCVCGATVNVNSNKSTNTLFGGAGILGQVKNAGILIDSTTFSGKLITVTNINNYHFGGIVAYNTANNLTITNCTNTANINITQHYCGGIIGRSTGSNLKITDCTNSGTITTTKNYTCGIAGDVKDATISGCSNSAAITGEATVCGIVGYSQGTTSVTNCANTGAVSGRTNLGGIVANSPSTSAVTISKCENSGDVTSTGNNCAGVLGNASGAVTISNCKNYGVISGATYVGGVAGYMSGTLNISQCGNTGEINATSIASGICGYAPASGSISECFNTAKITSSNNIGGIVGSFTSSASKTAGEVKNCYSSGAMYSKGQICGGIVGELLPNNKVTSCYATGKFERSSTSTGRVMGTIVGRANNGAWSGSGKNCNNVISYVVAWPNPTLKAGGSDTQGGSGAIVGIAATKNTYTKCWRRWEVAQSGQTGAVYNFYNKPASVDAPCDQGNTTSDITTGIGGNSYWYPYHGDAAQDGSGNYYTTVKDVVINLINAGGETNWDTTNIWDVTTDFPTLRNNPEPKK